MTDILKSNSAVSIFLNHHLLIARRTISQSTMSLRVYFVLFILIGLGLFNKIADESLKALTDIFSDPEWVKILFLLLPWLIPVISMMRFPVTMQTQKEFMRNRFYFFLVSNQGDWYRIVTLRFMINALPGFLTVIFFMMKCVFSVIIPVSVFAACFVEAMLMIYITAGIHSLLFWYRFASAGYSGRKLFLNDRLLLMATLLLGEIFIIGLAAIFQFGIIIFLQMIFSAFINGPVFNSLIFIVVTLYSCFLAWLLNKMTLDKFVRGNRILMKGIQSSDAVKIYSAEDGNNGGFFHRLHFDIMSGICNGVIPAAVKFFLKSVFKSAAGRSQIISPVILFTVGIIVLGFTQHEIQLIGVPLLTMLSSMSIVAAFHPSVAAVTGMLDMSGYTCSKPVTGMLAAWLIIFVPMMMMALIVMIFTGLEADVVIFSLFTGAVLNTPFILLCCMHPSSVMVPQMLMIAFSGILIYLFMIGQLFFMSAGYIIMLVIFWKQYRRAWVEKNLW